MQPLLRRSLVLLAAVCAPLAACSGSSSTDNRGTGGANASGGAAAGGQTGTGGGVSTGGTSATGGRVGTGGTTATGGTTVTPGTGGQAATGGISATGGRTGTGGNSATGGTTPTGGTSRTGGRNSDAGVLPGTGGNSTGGAANTGGTTVVGTGGAGPADGGVVLNPTACSTGTAQSGDVTVNLSGVQQKITGFGVSSAWAGTYRNASDPDYLWSTTTGAGLSLLRIRYGDGLAIAQAAAKAGATVWLTPWGTGTNGSPGGVYTTTQNSPNGCTGKGNMPVLTDLPGFAGALVTWVQNAKSKGVPIYAVSAANEPDSCGINQTTSYSAEQLTAWIKVLGPAMANIGVKVMAPETMNVCGFTPYYNSIKADSAAWNIVDIFASHEYGCGTLPSLPAIAQAGKEYWETEVDTGAGRGDTTGDGIASALPMATTLHNDMTKANLNAWHIWWLYNASGNGGNLYDTTTNKWTKRLWVLGNYARFVRPGFYRVSTSGTSPSGVLVSAYRNQSDGTVVIVAINSNTSATPVSLFVSGVVPCSITPWVTSATDDLASKPAISVSNGRFSATLDAQSVTSFVGKL